MLGPVLLELTVLFALCVAVAAALHRLRLPPVVAFLLTGAFVGPHSLGLVKHEEVVVELAEVGVVVLLFTVGIEISVGQLVRLRRAIAIGGSMQIGITVVLGAAVAMVLGLPWNQAVFLGFLLSLSSTAAITKILGDQGEFSAPHGRVAVGICLAQDLAVVPMILLVPLLAGGGDATGGALLWQTLKSFVLLILAAAATRVAVPRVLDLVARTRSRELFVLTLATLCLGMAVVTHELGMSLALGAFLAGILLADSDYHHQAVAEVEPFRDALASLFFVSIGMLFDPMTIFEHPAAVLLALLAVLGGKAAVVMVAARALGMPFWFRVRTALTLAQVGEFSFVLVQVGGGSTLLPEELKKVFLVVSVLSIAATPLMYALGKAMVRRARGRDGGRGGGGSLLRDHAVVIGFGPTGQAVAGALRTLGIPFVVLEMNAATVKKYREQGVPIMLGDSTRSVTMHTAGVDSAHVVVVAINDAEAARRTVQLVQRLAPQVHVIARATYLAEVALLHKIGANEVVPQELETSVEIMVRTLRRFLVPGDEIGRQVKTARDAAGGTDKLAGLAPADATRIGEFVPGIAMQVFRVEDGAAMQARTLEQSGLRRQTGCAVVAVRRAAENLPAVTPDMVLELDDVVVVIGPEACMADAAAMFQSQGAAAAKTARQPERPDAARRPARPEVEP